MNEKHIHKTNEQNTQANKTTTITMAREIERAKKNEYNTLWSKEDGHENMGKNIGHKQIQQQQELNSATCKVKHAKTTK